MLSSLRPSSDESNMRDLTEQGVDAVVLRLAENVVLATGWYTQIPGLSFVVIGAGGATLMVPDHEVDEAAEIWKDLGPYFPLNTGFRFSLKARMPSWRSSVGIRRL